MSPANDDTNIRQARHHFLKRWLKRVGWLGLLFFLVKGLVWIFLAYILVK